MAMMVPDRQTVRPKGASFPPEPIHLGRKTNVTVREFLFLPGCREASGRAERIAHAVSFGFAICKCNADARHPRGTPKTTRMTLVADISIAAARAVAAVGIV
jgi:hypothetical protein